jgi:WD40 repeat protein
MWLTFVAARPDGEFLAVARKDGWLGVWLPIDNRIITSHTLGKFINKIGWTPDGKHLLATGPDELHVFSGDGMTRVSTIATGHGGLRTFAVHPTQPIVATTGSDGMVRLWELPSGTKVRDALESRAGKFGSGTALALSEHAIMAGYENGYYATCDPDGSNPGGGQLFGGDVASLALVQPLVPAPGSSFMAGGGKGKLAELFVSPEKMMCTDTWSDPPKQIAANTIEFAADGKFVVACSDNTALLFDSHNDRAPSRLGDAFWSERKSWKQDYIVSAACFVPKTKLVATSHFAGYVKLWRTDKTWNPPAEVRFENDEVKWSGHDPKAWPTLD